MSSDGDQGPSKRPRSASAGGAAGESLPTPTTPSAAARPAEAHTPAFEMCEEHSAQKRRFCAKHMQVVCSDCMCEYHGDCGASLTIAKACDHIRDELGTLRADQRDVLKVSNYALEVAAPVKALLGEVAMTAVSLSGSLDEAFADVKVAVETATGIISEVDTALGGQEMGLVELQLLHQELLGKKAAVVAKRMIPERVKEGLRALHAQLTLKLHAWFPPPMPPRPSSPPNPLPLVKVKCEVTSCDFKSKSKKRHRQHKRTLHCDLFYSVALCGKTVFKEDWQEHSTTCKVCKKPPS